MRSRLKWLGVALTLTALVGADVSAGQATTPPPPPKTSSSAKSPSKSTAPLSGRVPALAGTSLARAQAHRRRRRRPPARRPLRHRLRQHQHQHLLPWDVVPSARSARPLRLPSRRKPLPPRSARPTRSLRIWIRNRLASRWQQQRRVLCLVGRRGRRRSAALAVRRSRRLGWRIRVVSRGWVVVAAVAERGGEWCFGGRVRR